MVQIKKSHMKEVMISILIQLIIYIYIYIYWLNYLNRFSILNYTMVYITTMYNLLRNQICVC